MKLVANKIKQLISVMIILLPIFAILYIKKYHPDVLEVNAVLAFVEKIYSNYSIPILLVAEFSKSIIGINIYMPGSMVILLGATLAARGVISLPAVIFWATIGLVMGHVLNYLMGRFGWYNILAKFKFFSLVDRAKKQVVKSRKIYFWSTIHPHMASVTTLAAGIMKINFKEFLIAVTLFQFFWAAFWGVLFTFLEQYS